MAKPRACKACKIIFEGDRCPKCEGKDFTEGWKGRVLILNPEQSEIAQKLKIKDKGAYAIKTK